MIRAVALVLLASCTTAEQDLDEATGAELGHHWSCVLEIQYGDPVLSVETVTPHPCLLPGPDAVDAFEHAWFTSDCNPKVEGAGAPGGGYCHADCEPDNWDLCVPGDDS